MEQGPLFSMKAFDADRDLPIVYCDHYNITMIGIELMHQFDSKKFGKIATYLSDDFMDTPFARVNDHDESPEQRNNPVRSRRLRYLQPSRPVNFFELQMHHTGGYIKQIHQDKSLCARIMEIWLINAVPMTLVENRLLKPLKWQVAGTLFAIHLAMQHGWAINLGGGFHQASADNGESFCIFSDIFLAMKYYWRKHPLTKFMIIDLDAHQASGLDRDIADLEEKRRKMVFMIDLFNSSIQPPDARADQGIDIRVELARFTGDKTYLQKLEDTLEAAFSKFKPNMIIYVAGQDILKGDQLGLLNVTDEALKRRDEIVFTWAAEKLKCPILMLLGGGFLTRGARLQADSIRGLFAKGLIWGGQKSGSRSLSRPRKNLKTTVSTSVSKSASKMEKFVQTHMLSPSTNRLTTQSGLGKNVTKTAPSKKETTIKNHARK